MANKIRYDNFKLIESDDALLPSLSVQHREILIAVSELPFECTLNELASGLGIKHGTLKSQLHRARAALSYLREKEAA